MENSPIDEGRAVPFVTYSNKNFVISDEAKEILNNPNYKQLGIISLVGKYRTGKSFLLNRVLLNQKEKNGFGVAPTIKPCTKGIWMWSKPILIENIHSKEKFYSFFIDTEGLGAYDEEINHDSKIFLVAVLISSLFILNSFGNIDENAINSLSFIINLSKTIKLTQQSNEANPDDLASYFPSLLWLLRDFSLKLEDTQGNVITAKQYLENALQLQKGCSEAVEEKNKIRKLITQYFKERDCFSMVRPIENEKDLQNLQSIDDCMIRKEFLDQADILRNKVFKRVKPKIFNNRVLSGSMLVELLQDIVESINKGAVPVIENSWKYMVHNESIKNMKYCLEKFKGKMNEFKENNKENPTFFRDLKKFENETMNNIIQEFHKESLSYDSPETLEFSNKLKGKIQEELQRFTDDNNSLFENRMNDSLERNLKKLHEAFETDKYSKNYYIFFRDLENLKEVTESSIPDFKNKKELIYEKMIGVIKKFIEMTFLKNKILNEKEIATLKNENSNLKSNLSSRNEEYDKLKTEVNAKVEKLNAVNVELKLKEKTFEDKFKQLLTEKKNLNINAEEKIKNINIEFTEKIEKLKQDLNKAELDLKNKDDHLMMIKYSEEKMNALNVQKIEYMEKDIFSYKERMEAMKYDNASLKSTIEELNQKIEELKNEVNHKKVLEIEIEKLKKENEEFLLKNKRSSLLFSPNNFNYNKNYAFNEDININSDNLDCNLNQNLPILNNIDPNSEGYILIRLIKEVLNNQSSDSQKIFTDLSTNISQFMNKISNDNTEILKLNKTLTENIVNFEKRYSTLEFKYESLKQLKKIYKQASCLQCKNCNKLIDNQNFINGHSNICSKKENNTHVVKNASEQLKIKILKGVLNKDELGKPFIEYITEINYNSNIWRVNKKFNQFANLHKSLKNIVGEDFKFPESSNIFVKIIDNNNFHENKIKQLESYIREISDIPAISNSKIFRKFFEFNLNSDDILEPTDNIDRAIFNNNNSNSNSNQTNTKYNPLYKDDSSDSEKQENKICSKNPMRNTNNLQNDVKHTSDSNFIGYKKNNYDQDYS